MAQQFRWPIHSMLVSVSERLYFTQMDGSIPMKPSEWSVTSVAFCGNQHRRFGAS